MGLLRAAAAVLIAGIAVWLLWPGGGPGGEEADSDPYAEVTGGEHAPEGALEGDAGLRGSKSVLPPPTEEGSHAFRFIARHADTDELLSGIRVDDTETGFVGETNEDGELLIERPLERFEFTAWADGFALRTGTARTGTDSLLFMSPGVPVTGVVLDRETRAAVPDATIRAWDVDAEAFVSGAVGTDEQGRFELEGVRLHHPFTLLITPKDRVPTHWAGVVHGAPAELEVLVDAAGTITGTVVDAEGEPVAGRPVFLLPPGRRIPGEERAFDPWRDATPVPAATAQRRAFEVGRVLTDDEGRFELKGVPFARPATVVAQIDARERLASMPIVLTAEAPERAIELTLKKRGTVKIYIAEPSGQAVKNALLRLESPLVDFGLDREIGPGPDGWRVYDDIPHGVWTAVVQIPDGPRHQRRFSLRKDEPVEVRFKTVTEGFLSGRVVGPAGEAISGARVRWYPMARGDPIVDVLTKGGGQFVMRGIRGDAKNVRVDPPRSYEARARYEHLNEGPVAEGQKGYELRLEEREMLEGFVSSRVTIERMSIEVVTGDMRSVKWVEPPKDGRFTLRMPPTQPGIVVFRVKDLAPTVISYKQLTDLPHKLYRVWLEDLRSIPVTVRSGSTPVAGARIRSADPRLGLVWRTDRNGEAVLTGLPGGSSNVLVDSEWHAPLQQKVSPTAAGTRNQLRLGEQIGIVSGAVTRYLERQYALQLVIKSTRRKGRKTVKIPARDPSGWFEARAPAGVYQVWVTYKSGRLVRYLGMATVKAGQRTSFGTKR